MEETVFGALVAIMLAYGWFAHIHGRRHAEAASAESIERSGADAGARSAGRLPRLLWETKKMRSGMKTAALGISLNALLIAVGAVVHYAMGWDLHPAFLIGPCAILAINLLQFLKTGSMSMMDWFLTDEDRLLFGKHQP